MSETTAAPKRRYQRIAPEHLAYARKRFAEFASTSAVRAELRAQGGDYAHNALFHHWKKYNDRPARCDGAAGDAQGGGE